MSAALRVSVVVIGDEILGGFVRDTNSGWLAQRLQALGHPLDHVATVPDALDAIDEALRIELARQRPRLVVTSGGVGSTPDDLTFEAVARHLRQGLRLESSIDDRIRAALAWTAGQGMTVDERHERSMRKMAMVPESSYLLSGAAGFVPAVAVDVEGGCRSPGGATIVVLPGVPELLQRLFTDAVEPELLSGLGHPQHVVEMRHPYPESTLNPVLDRLVEGYPDVHVGSYPGRECTIRLKGDRDRVEAAAAEVRTYLAELAADPAAERLSRAWQARWG